MDCLYDIQQKDGCFFRETIASRANPETIFYQKDVKRKADPLLIVFMNSFTSQDFDGHSLPAVFSKMLLFFQSNQYVQEAWHNDILNATFVSNWFSSGVWVEGLSQKEDDARLFFLGTILESTLEPIIHSSDSNTAQMLVKIIMTTDWNCRRRCVKFDPANPLMPYWERICSRILNLGMFWHFIKHQAAVDVDGCFGQFPEKKVRFFCRNCLNISIDERRRDNFDEALGLFEECWGRYWDNPRDSWIRYYLRCPTNPEELYSTLDKAYSHYARIGDSFRVRNLLDILCLSLLYFAIYDVPIRQCSLCQQFYIPVKNQSGDMNFCHRNFNPKSNQTCSSYHSHNQKSILPDKELSPAKALENSIGTIRSTFSQSNVYSFPNGRAWLDFLRDVVTIVSRTSRKDAQKIEQCSQILDRIKQLHKIMKTVKCCPEKDTPSLDPKTDDLENADARLRVAEETVAAMLEKEKPDFPA